MTKEEYDLRLKQIEQEADTQRRRLYKEYALANNPYHIGDIVEDHIGKLQIEKIVVTLAYSSRIPRSKQDVCDPPPSAVK